MCVRGQSAESSPEPGPYLIRRHVYVLTSRDVITSAGLKIFTTNFKEAKRTTHHISTIVKKRIEWYVNKNRKTLRNMTKSTVTKAKL